MSINLTLELTISATLNILFLGALIWQRQVINKLSAEVKHLYTLIGEKTIQNRDLH
jgi:hypothetical protein